MKTSTSRFFPPVALLVILVSSFTVTTTDAFSATTASTRVSKTVSTALYAENTELLGLPARPGRPLKVAIAGGGVGGLTAALCCLKKGMDVTIYEKTQAFARFGGPIQFASNALSTLKEIDETVFERVMEKFTFTGTRVCGIKDGLRADGTFRMTDDSWDFLVNKDAPPDWFVKFPLKVSNVMIVEVCKLSYFIFSPRLSQTQLNHTTNTAMRRSVWSALHRCHRSSRSARDSVGRMQKA